MSIDLFKYPHRNMCVWSLKLAFLIDTRCDLTVYATIERLFVGRTSRVLEPAFYYSGLCTNMRVNTHVGRHVCMTTTSGFATMPPLHHLVRGEGSTALHIDTQSRTSPYQLDRVSRTVPLRVTACSSEHLAVTTNLSVS